MNINIIDFMKKYTKIDNNFIDDFFGLYDPDDENNFSINIDVIAKWLNIRKDNIKKTLKKSYKENEDYKINSTNTLYRGKPNEQILLTPKCFKIMSMQSKSLKADKVREYYYELEQVLDRYKEHIIYSLDKKINMLENNQKPIVNPRKGIIYIIQTSDDIGLYKLGKTTNLKKRLNSYNADKKDNIIPLYMYESEDIDLIEKCVKNFTKEYQYRKHKEIYKININILKLLIENCAEFNKNTKIILKNKSNQIGGKLYVAIYK
jgi:hypothetical protein